MDRRILLRGLGCGLGTALTLLAGVGCRSPRSEIPPPRSYMGGAAGGVPTSGATAPPQVDFSTQPPPLAANGYSQDSPGNVSQGGIAAMPPGYGGAQGGYGGTGGGYGAAPGGASAGYGAAPGGYGAAGGGLPAPDPLQDVPVNQAGGLVDPGAGLPQ